MKRIYDWMVRMLSEMREEVKPPDVSPVSILGEFINCYLNNALVVNEEVDARNSLAPLPLSEPKGELLIRFEPDTKALYIAAGPFKKYCVSRQINYKDTLKTLEEVGAYVESCNKRLSRGMKVVSPPVRSLKFDATNFDLIKIDNYIRKDEDRVDNVPS